MISRLKKTHVLIFYRFLHFVSSCFLLSFSLFIWNIINVIKVKFFYFFPSYVISIINEFNMSLIRIEACIICIFIYSVCLLFPVDILLYAFMGIACWVGKISTAICQYKNTAVCLNPYNSLRHIRRLLYFCQNMMFHVYADGTIFGDEIIRAFWP